MTLGDYKGMELTKTVQDVTDEQIQTQIDSDLKTEAKLWRGRTCQMGDILNIDYVGRSMERPLTVGARMDRGRTWNWAAAAISKALRSSWWTRRRRDP